MRGLRLTVFVLSLSCLTVELVRHTYIRWIESHESVLLKYNAIDKEIQDATSLAALEKRYAEELEKEKVARQNRPPVPDNAAGHPGQYQPPDYNSPVYKFRQAIETWQATENQVRELRYFWGGGFVCLMLALGAHWRGWYWPSIALQLTGFAEMTWWTCPSFGLTGAVREYSRLLNYRITFTILALVLLLVFWFAGVLRPREEPR